MAKAFQCTFNYKLIYVFRINDVEHRDIVKIGDATVANFFDKALLTDNSEMLNKVAKERIDS